MSRSRIVAAGVGVAALGIATVLVPAVSSADQAAVAAPAGTVRWVDSASDLTQLSADPSAPLGDRWYGASFGTGDGSGSLPVRPVSDAATFGPTGLTLDGASPVVLAHGFAKPMPASALPAAFDGAAVRATGSSNFAVLVQFPDSQPIAEFPSSNAVSGVDGANTTWGPDGASVSTQEFADGLERDHATVVGYAEYLGLAIEGSAGPQSTSTAPSAAQQGTLLAPEAGTPEPGATTSASPLAAAPRVSRAAVRSTLQSITFDDVTTDFTPQSTAHASVPTTTLTRATATTTGTPVSGSGFVPGETVRVAVAQGNRAEEITGTTFVADAAGNVAGTVVLPAGFVTGAGTYDLVLVGDASAQTASVALTVTDDPAVPVAAPATPVRSTATFTG
ncbi:hypothetical protein ACTJKO_01615 [Curtobacterium sp. 22159]|uniref:hypothetical protein n=1 Tax=Curtobacterium sp. 22159 TaxID=3453882 RepID=UPI003F859B35